MPNLPKQYQFLSNEDGPRMLTEALKLYGTIEGPGTKDNPTIMGWAKELGISKWYTSDAIPWCGLFMAVVAKRAAKEVPKNFLQALAWAGFGTALGKVIPKLGDVVVLVRKGGGHVGLCVGISKDYVHLLGGNQDDQVCIRKFPAERVYTVCRPHYNNQPANVRSIFYGEGGTTSQSEA